MQTQNATDKHIVSYFNVNLKKTRMKQHQKTRFFSVRMTNAEYDHLQLACYKDGLTKGEFIRRHLTELLKHGTYANTPTKSTNQDS